MSLAEGDVRASLPGKVRSTYQGSPIQIYLQTLLEKIKALKEKHAHDDSMEKKDAEKLMDGAKTIIELLDQSILPAFSDGKIPGISAIATLIKKAWGLKDTFKELAQLLGQRSKKQDEQMISHPMLYDFINYAVESIETTPETFAAFMPFLNPKAFNLCFLPEKLNGSNWAMVSAATSLIGLSFDIERNSQDLAEYGYTMRVEKNYQPVGLSQVSHLPNKESLKGETQDHFYLTQTKLSLYNHEEKEFLHFDLTQEEAKKLQAAYPENSKIPVLSEAQRTELAKVMVASDINEWGLSTTTLFENGLMKMTTQMDLEVMYLATKKKLPSLLNDTLNQGNELLQELLAAELKSLEPEQNVELADLSLEALKSALDLSQRNLLSLGKKQNDYAKVSCETFLTHHHPSLLEKHRAEPSNKIILAKLLPKAIIGRKPSSNITEIIGIKTVLVSACSRKTQELNNKVAKLEREIQLKIIEEAKNYKETKISELRESLAKLSNPQLPNAEADKETLTAELKNLEKAQDEWHTLQQKIKEAQLQAHLQEKIDSAWELESETSQAVKQNFVDLNEAFNEGLQRCVSEEKQLAAKIQKLENMILLKDVNLEKLQKWKEAAEKALERQALEAKQSQAKQEVQIAAANYNANALDFSPKQEILNKKIRSIDIDLSILVLLADKLNQATAEEGLDFTVLDALIKDQLSPKNLTELDIFDLIKTKATELVESETIDFLGFSGQEKDDLQAYKRQQMRPFFKPEAEENQEKIQLVKDKINEKIAALKEERIKTLKQLDAENNHEKSFIETITLAQRELMLAEEGLATLPLNPAIEEAIRLKHDKNITVLSQLAEFFTAHAKLNSDIEGARKTLTFDPLKADAFNPEEINTLFRAQEKLAKDLADLEKSLNQLEAEDGLRATLGVIKPLVDNAQKSLDSLFKETFDLKPMEIELKATLTKIRVWQEAFDSLEKDNQISVDARLNRLARLIEEQETLTQDLEKVLGSAWLLAEVIDEIKQPGPIKTQVEAIAQAFDALSHGKDLLDSSLEAMKKTKESHQKRQKFTNELMVELSTYLEARKVKDAIFTKTKTYFFPQHEKNRLRFIEDLIENLQRYQTSGLDENAIVIQQLIKRERELYPSKRLQPILSRIYVAIHDHKYPNASKATPADQEPHNGIDRVINDYFKPYLNGLESHFKSRVQDLIQGIEKDLTTYELQTEELKELIVNRIGSLDDEAEAQTPTWKDLVDRLKAVVLNASLMLVKKIAPSMASSFLLFHPKYQLSEQLLELDEVKNHTPTPAA